MKIVVGAKRSVGLRFVGNSPLCQLSIRLRFVPMLFVSLGDARQPGAKIGTKSLQ